MGYDKVFDYLSTVVRTRDKKKLVIPPFHDNIRIEPGYYSQAGVQGGDVTPINEEDKNKYFEINGTAYEKKDGVVYLVNCSISAFSNFLNFMSWSKSELSGADLHRIVEKVTFILWKAICGNKLNDDLLGIPQRRIYDVNMANPMEDVYAGIYNIVYYLIYDILAKDRCECTEDVQRVMDNIRRLNQYDNESSEVSDQVRTIIGRAIDRFTVKFIQPFLITEAAKVGQAHVNENLTSIMSEYKDLKTKVHYIVGGQVDETRYFTILQDYINMVLGNEDSFYNLLNLIITENLDKDLERLQEKLTIDKDKLENFLKRLIITNVDYVNKNVESVHIFKRKLESDAKTTANAIEEGVKKIMAEQLEFMETEYGRSWESDRKLPITKITNCKFTRYAVRVDPSMVSSQVYEEIKNRALELSKLLKKLGERKLVSVEDKNTESYESMELKLHYYDSMSVEIRFPKGENKLPHFRIYYEKANMELNRSQRLAWERVAR